MLVRLKIGNVALIDHLSIEFGEGLNLLTGETGSGKSIIVDSLGALTGKRVSTDLIKDGCDRAVIEGLFELPPNDSLQAILTENGIDAEAAGLLEVMVRREISAAGKNRTFINDRLVTQGFLRGVGEHLVDIHGQGEQATLYDVGTHIDLLDDFAGANDLRGRVTERFSAWARARSDLAALEKDESEKLQLLDVLRFQISELEAANLLPGEEDELEAEKRRLANIEKLTMLSDEAFGLLYDNQEAAATTLERAERRVHELAEFDARFTEYADGIASARAVIDDLSIAIRDFRSRLEFSPVRLEEIENRLAELSRLKRKYGGTIEKMLEHLESSRTKLAYIEMSELREEELRARVEESKLEYSTDAGKLHDLRVAAAKKFESAVVKNLEAVALEKARFEVRINRSEDELSFGPSGYDEIEFYFSANPGESPKPLARVASGGEASRLMLILKTSAKSGIAQKSAVFDEIDIGIGGRVAESVGRKLKDLSANQQVLCVTHQPQIASLADRHFIVEKSVEKGRTTVGVRELEADERVEELARMLAGETVTDQARENARAMLAAAG